ncbi:MAG TPA: ABC transporter ATP-binding protein [Candidatus Pullichristensenella excrementigallinarum]|uniref:ABC transporter ATP-binding protein n=1 Tax=Candidatus Pullichristensenella excrementigallinarum TaxID=2840907 RepID=A0A9D1IAB9_9FIRM|nr:ABC transporter ATP-binding protein [Candidatus Pullichristensenella excrementigallinarum]
MKNTTIRVDNVTKRYGDKTIISDLSLEVKGGEFFTLLGPSGCGKTTLLRMIAGFNTIEGGTIYFNDTPINDIKPYKRNIGMVFQNYAIFPHMSVRKNIEYGLVQRHIPRPEIKKRVDEIIETVKIGEHAEKSPNQLSGGQQQRVALARAIVIHPAVLLMDEPLSNLDAKLRVEMRTAIRDVQKEVDITTVYVTHDQEEALVVSDRIAVMNFGKIQQIGAPLELYTRPANLFVATFVGTNNVFDGSVVRGEGGPAVTVGPMTIPMPNLSPDAQDGQKVKVTIRPEELRFVSDSNALVGRVKARTFLGSYIDYEILLPDGEVIEISQDAGDFANMVEVGKDVALGADAKRVNVFTEDGASSLIRG